MSCVLWSGVVARRLIAVLGPRSQHRSYTHAASGHVHTGLPEKMLVISGNWLLSAIDVVPTVLPHRIAAPKLRLYSSGL